MRIYVRLSEILEERGITQKELAERTGIRRATISDICRHQDKAINREHIVKIAEELGITKITEIIEFRK